MEASGKIKKYTNTIKMDVYWSDSHLFHVFHVDTNLIQVIDMESPQNDWYVFEFEWEAVEYIQNRVWARELIEKTK